MKYSVIIKNGKAIIAAVVDAKVGITVNSIAGEGRIYYSHLLAVVAVCSKVGD